MQQNSFSYPAMLDLKNKKCVIIGGGKVAVRKALPLIEAGADLTVIAPAADPQLLTLAKTGLRIGRDSNVMQEFLHQHLVFVPLHIDVADRISGKCTCSNISLGLTSDGDITRCWHL